MRVSYLEIYNEEVRDLLSKDQNVRLEVRPQNSSEMLQGRVWGVRSWCQRLFSLEIRLCKTHQRNGKTEGGVFARSVAYVDEAFGLSDMS